MIPTSDQLIAAQAKRVCAYYACDVEFTPKPTHPAQKYCCVSHGKLAYHASHKRASNDDSLAASILRRLEDGPGTVEELRLEIGHCSHKAVGMALKRLTDAGKAVRLYLLDEQRLGGPRSWVYGLAGVSYSGKQVSLKSRVLEYLAAGGATTAELVAAFPDCPAGSVSCCVSELRGAGKVRRAGRMPGTNPHGGAMPWLYELGREPEVVAKRRHTPDPARIAGHTYHRELAGWGVWR